MAKDDYFVVVYRMLKYLYNCLKRGKTPDKELLSPEYFNISVNRWLHIIRELYRYGYVEGVTITRLFGIPDYPSLQAGFQITPKGIEYIEVGTVFNKIRKSREITDLIP